MERRGQMEAEVEALRRSQIAIRCARSALLISSLKSWPDRCPKSAVEDDQDSEKKDLMRAVLDLKMEVVRLRRRNRQMVLYSFMEVLLLMAVLLFLWITCLVLAFKFH